MKLCFWRKNFTNCFKARVEVGPFCVDLWKHDASRLWEWSEQFLCSMKAQMVANPQILHMRKIYSLGNVRLKLWSLAGFVPLDFIPAHGNPSGLSLPGLCHLHTSPADLHTDIYKLDWPVCSLALFKTGLGFFLVIECSPRQQVFSCQSRDKIA